MTTGFSLSAPATAVEPAATTDGGGGGGTTDTAGPPGMGTAAGLPGGGMGDFPVGLPGFTAATTGGVAAGGDTGGSAVGGRGGATVLAIDDDGVGGFEGVPGVSLFANDDDDGVDVFGGVGEDEEAVVAVPVALALAAAAVGADGGGGGLLSTLAADGAEIGAAGDADEVTVEPVALDADAGLGVVVLVFVLVLVLGLLDVDEVPSSDLELTRPAGGFHATLARGDNRLSAGGEGGGVEPVGVAGAGAFGAAAIDDGDDDGADAVAVAGGRGGTPPGRGGTVNFGVGVEDTAGLSNGDGLAG